TDTFPGDLAGPVRPGVEFEVAPRADRGRNENLPALESIPLRRVAEALESQRPVDADLGAERPQAEGRRRRRLDPGDISILIESSPEDEAVAVLAAPLSRRFLAGVADALMVLLALVFFFAIFWWVVAGEFHLRLVHVGALSIVVSFVVFSYFAMFG